jgi:hypothetical protein
VSLVFVPPAPQSPEGSSASAGPWWPAIDYNDVRDALRLGDVITQARLMAAVRGALVTVLDELRDWQAAQVAAGFTSLGSVNPPAPVLQDQPHRRFRAVYDPFLIDGVYYLRPPCPPPVAPAAQIDGVSRLEECFRRAVRFYAAAELAEIHRDITATAEGSARADAQLLSADDYRRLATAAVRDILGKTRVTAELI